MTNSKKIEEIKDTLKEQTRTKEIKWRIRMINDEKG